MNLEIILNLITTTAIILGIFFGLMQIRNAVKERRDHAAVDIVRAVQTQEIRQAMSKILSLPYDTDPIMIREDPELLQAALAIDSACEMWGCMVFEGVVDHKMLDRMVGGWVRGSWLRLHKWVESERIENKNINVGEWWQWLFELLKSDPDPGKSAGAHIFYSQKFR